MTSAAMKPLLDRLMRHARWANERTLASLRTLDAPPADAVRLLAHVVTAEAIYLARMRGDDPFPQDFWPELTLEELEPRIGETGAALQAFVAARSEAALRQPVRYRNSRGVVFETPLDQMLTHLALHGEHHRGQIARLVRAAGGTPAVTDLIAFVREEDPSQQISNTKESR